MKYRLEINDNLSLEELQNEIQNGAKFVVYKYVISPLAITLHRLSPAIFIAKNNNVAYKSRYNRITYFFGWWCIPWGPMRSIQSIKTNNLGGIDVTDDIMTNINEESLKNKEVDLITTTLLFNNPDKPDDKAFSKAINEKLGENNKLKKIVVGLYVNVDRGVSPYYIIGIKSEDDFQNHIEPITKALYTQFYKRVLFKFINLDSSDSFCNTLEKQGKCFMDR